MLVAHGLTVTYGATMALTDVSACVVGGEVVAVTGSSGSGKTTLLHCLAGLVRPARGEVTLDGSAVTGLGSEELAELRRRKFGFVFQFAELVPELTLYENVALPLQLLGVPRQDVRRRVDALLEQLHLSPQARSRPAQVSGGQAQRAAVARALIHHPAVVFADEPTGSLDTRNGQQVLALLLALSRERNASVILVTHDRLVAASADRELRMADGRLVRADA